MNRLDGKIALITGGARGQGAAEAALFAEAGAQVVISDVLDDEGKALAETLGEAVSYLHHDVSSSAEWAEVVGSVVEQHGRLDVLVNNAGIFRMMTLEETSDEDWQQMIDINQTGVFYGLREVAPIMREQGSGSIVNISSIAGLTGASVAFSYGATKWAVRGMSKAAARDLAPHGVRVNSVHPGLIDTPMFEEFGPGGQEMAAAAVPMGRLADADEVGRLVRYLASDDSAYCTGQEFTIDGGFTL